MQRANVAVQCGDLTDGSKLDKFQTNLAGERYLHHAWPAKCRVSPADWGKHSIAGVLTDEFLDYTASNGNDLRAAGLTAGCKWCLCVLR
jgi:Uncharacterized protein conserved in bacteria (DUF2237)